jgi:hypothetical protein
MIYNLILKVVIVSMFFPFNIFAQERNTMSYASKTINVDISNAFIKDDSLYVDILYINQTDDTIALPFQRLRYTNFQEFIFIDDSLPEQNLPCCGIVSDYIVPEYNLDINCNSIYAKRSPWVKIIAPNDTLCIRFNATKNGYYTQSYIRGHAYKFYIKLDLPNWLKMDCNNMIIGTYISKIFKFFP